MYNRRVLLTPLTVVLVGWQVYEHQSSCFSFAREKKKKNDEILEILVPPKFQSNNYKNKYRIYANKQDLSGKFSDSSWPDFLVYNLSKGNKVDCVNLKKAPANHQQQNKITLVVGSKGSGKTFYSLFDSWNSKNDFPIYVDCALTMQKKQNNVVLELVKKSQKDLAKLKQSCGEKALLPRHFIYKQLNNIDIPLLGDGSSSSEDDAMATTLILDNVESLPQEDLLRCVQYCKQHEISLICTGGFPAMEKLTQTNENFNAVGLKTYWAASSILDFAKQIGINDLDEYAAMQLSGRPAHAIRFFEAMLSLDSLSENFPMECLNKTKDFFFETYSNQLKELKTTQSELYDLVLNLSLDRMYGGEGKYLGKELFEAIQLNVCCLSSPSSDQGENNSDSMIHAAIVEPFFLSAFHKEAKRHFVSLLNSDASALGFEFERYLAVNAQEIVNLCTDLNRLVGLNKGNDEFLSGIRKNKKLLNVFNEKWTLLSENVSAFEQFAVKSVRGGDEAEILSEMIQAYYEGRAFKYPSVLFPSTLLGPDLIVLCKNEKNPKQVLVILIQAKVMDECKLIG